MDRRNTLLITFICGVAVGNLYEAQPLLVEVADAFGASPAAVGLVATLSQVGYGLGVLLLVPLGDAIERRGLIVTLLLAVAAAMAASGLAPSLAALATAQFFVGLSTVTPQVLIPYAATLATPAQRATTLGTIQSGLLIGILMARTFAGAVADVAGWRGVFFVAATMSVALAGIVRWRLPAQPVHQKVRYRALLASMGQLLAREPALRRAAAASALNFAAFSAFWTTLAFLLDDAFHMGPGAVGLFGLVGVAGALGASAAGRLTDRHGPRAAQRASLALTVLSFALFLPGGHSLPWLVLGVVVMDAGVQAAHLALQAEVFSLQPEARGRLNGIYMFFRFAGGALGSLVGAWAWHQGLWPGVCLTGLALSLAALVPVGLRHR